MGALYTHSHAPRLARASCSCQVFKQGLLDVVTKTKAWIVTGGTNSGVMGLVGKAMAERPEHTESTVCLGVATWGVVRNHEVLNAKYGKVHKYESKDQALPDNLRWELGVGKRGKRSTVTTERGADEIRRRRGPRASLEPNHSHFIFVDAGDEHEGEFGHEIQMRADLEDTLSTDTTGHKHDAEEGGRGLQYPSCLMILIVVGGGVGTLKTVRLMLEKQRPVLVLAHSGGAAHDIYQYVVHQRMPTNEETYQAGTTDGGSAYAARAAAVAKSATELPLIHAQTRKVRDPGSKSPHVDIHALRC